MEVIEKGNTLESTTMVKTTGRVAAVEQLTEHFVSPAIGVISKDISGSILMVKMEDNSEVDFVWFPKEFSQPEVQFLLNKPVNYSWKHWRYLEGGAGYLTSDTYSLDVDSSDPDRSWLLTADLTH